MDFTVIEMNAWVDAVLQVVYDHGKGRNIIFSSFNPDICLLLSFKQVCVMLLLLLRGVVADSGFCSRQFQSSSSPRRALARCQISVPPVCRRPFGLPAGGIYWALFLPLSPSCCAHVSFGR